MENILAPSMLAADFKILGEQLRRTEEAGTKYIHFDGIDVEFVPSISFGMPVLSSVKDATGQLLDVHLMIKEPIRYIKEFAACGADIITVHLEACTDLKKTIDEIHNCNVKAGISVKPATSAEELIPYLDQADMFLVMSVEPGFGGQKFMPESLEKIRKIREMLEERNLERDIEVDGGIYQSNVAQVLEAGANVIVSGSGVYGGNIRKNVEGFMEILKKYE